MIHTNIDIGYYGYTINIFFNSNWCTYWLLFDHLRPVTYIYFHSQSVQLILYYIVLFCLNYTYHFYFVFFLLFLSFVLCVQWHWRSLRSESRNKVSNNACNLSSAVRQIGGANCSEKTREKNMDKNRQVCRWPILIYTSTKYENLYFISPSHVHTLI